MAGPRSLSDRELKQCVSHAERMFGRVLVAWASDLLELRRRNLLLPAWRHADPALPLGSETASQDGPPVLPMNDAA